MIDWQHIDSVFLDMDGTLLDLHFDNHFWREHVPRRYGEARNMSTEQAKENLFPKFKEAEGTLDWYCVDYWSQQLELDIAELKKEIDHLVAVHPHVEEFLAAVRSSRRRLLLVTNAHIKSLQVKMAQKDLTGHFHKIICSHDLGYPKESLEFWDKLKEVEPYQKEKTLFVDDSIPVLRVAQQYGIGHLLAIKRPDSKGPPKDVEDFVALDGFDQILPPGPGTASCT